MNDNLRLTSTVICDDVLANAAGRVTLYSVFRDLYADAYPAEVVRLHVVTTWLNPTPSVQQVVERVTILSPDQDDELVADVAAQITVRPHTYHTQISRFRTLVFPAPGAYRVQVHTGTEMAADIPLFLMAPPDGSGDIETQEEEV